MRRKIAILLSLVLIGESAAQDILIMKGPKSVYDLTLDPSDSEKLKGINSGAANSAALQAALHKVGAGVGARIRNPLYIPPNFYRTEGFTIGGRSNGTALAGGMLLGGGGFTPALSEASANGAIGNVTRLTYVGTTAANEHHVRSIGQNWCFGPIEMHGIRLQTGLDRVNRNSTNFTKCPRGIWFDNVETSGIGPGKFFGAVALMGYTEGLSVGSDGNPTENHNDNLTWEYLALDTCATGYRVYNEQSVNHRVKKLDVGSYVPTVFHFNRGGNLIVDEMQLNGSGSLLLKVDTPSTNWNGYDFRNVRIDNHADNFKLVELGTHGVPAIVRIVGTIGNDVTYTLNDLVVGENPGDLIYIRLYGPNGPVNEINDLSTTEVDPL